MYRIFRVFLQHSMRFLWYSGLFQPISGIFRAFSVLFSVYSAYFPSIPSISVHFLLFRSISVHFGLFLFIFHFIPLICDFPSIFRIFPYFRLVSLQFSILGSDRSEFGSSTDPSPFLCQPQLHFRHSPYVIVLLSSELLLPLLYYDPSLLFYSVYKSGKLGSLRQLVIQY